MEGNFTGLWTIAGVILGWYLNNLHIKEQEEPFLTLDIKQSDRSDKGPILLIGLKNTGGVAKDIKWRFIWEIDKGEKKAIPKDGPGKIRILGKGDTSFLFFISRKLDGTGALTEVKEQFYTGKLEVAYYNKFGKKRTWTLELIDLLDMLPMEIAQDNLGWIESIKETKDIYKVKF
jgi:hypothetical protein